MTPRTIRRIVLVVFVGGIGAMIAASIADSTGAALTFGLITAVAAVALILVTSVAGAAPIAPEVAEVAAAELERQVQALVDAGADESAVRSLVRQAARRHRPT
ncbi:hypothetical protein BH24ACT3_BH24ACT3_16270 [soil metagenome]